MLIEFTPIELQPRKEVFETLMYFVYYVTMYYV